MSAIIDYSENYTANCILAKPYLPKGHRFLKKGETVPCGAKHIGSNAVFYSSPYVGKETRDGLAPIFVPVKYARGAKGRFAPKNPPSEFPDVKSVAPWRFLTPSIVALENVLSGDVGELENSFEWASARRDGRGVYWMERCHKRVALSPSDLDFIRAAKEFFEKRIVELTPIPTVDIGSRMKKHIIEDHSEAQLRRRIRQIVSLLGGKMDELFGLFVWGNSPQGHSYWRKRYEGQVPVSPDDILYLRAVKEFMEVRVKELERPAPAPTPAVPEPNSGVNSGETLGEKRERIAKKLKAFEESLIGEKDYLLKSFHWWLIANEEDLAYIGHSTPVQVLTRVTERLRRENVSLTTEVADLKRKIAGAKVTFPA